ncbi:hypothetical protein MRX96_024311 [Rhipicephalus microplus]
MRASALSSTALVSVYAYKTVQQAFVSRKVEAAAATVFGPSAALHADPALDLYVLNAASLVRTRECSQGGRLHAGFSKCPLPPSCPKSPTVKEIDVDITVPEIPGTPMASRSPRQEREHRVTLDEPCFLTARQVTPACLAAFG